MSMWDEYAAKFELAMAENRIKELEDWKASMLAVESEWDVHELAKMLGLKLGSSCRKGIAEEVPKLLARIKKLEAMINNDPPMVPLSDVMPLLEALHYYTHQPYSAAARATDEFLTKHPEAKPQ